MKIKTYTARDMRSALRLVREEQGPDAVILSTRNGPQGVVVEVAVDPAESEALLVAATRAAPAPPTPAAAATAKSFELPLAPLPAPPAEAAPATPSFAQLLAVESGEAVRGRVVELRPAAPARAAAEPEAPGEPEPVALTADTRSTSGIDAELRSMRHLLEAQLGRLAWNDLSRRSPAQAELLKQLTEIGLAEDLAGELVQALPANLAFDEAQRRTLAQLSRRIAVTGDGLLDQGGRVAFVGPTGVGKTTLIAKLAARWVMRHGARDIALVSTDSQRFGAQEQLRVLGRLLGVEAYCVEDVTQLGPLLERLAARRLVLVDTAGQSPRDPELGNRAAALTQLEKDGGLRVCLTLSCAAQAGVIDDAIARFGAYAPAHCILTKLDEANSLGGTLSALIRHELPVSYVSDGQRIPEDLNPARAHQLVSRAVQLTRIAGATAGEELLTRRFGGTVHGRA